MYSKNFEHQLVCWTFYEARVGYADICEYQRISAAFLKQPKNCQDRSVFTWWINSKFMPKIKKERNISRFTH